MEFLSAYDNGGKTFDRFTIVFIEDGETYTYTMSSNALSPQGVCQFAGINLVPSHTAEQSVEYTDLPQAVKQQISSLIS